MKDYQKDFIELAIRADSLQFGSFTLKSGRSSPYFYNSGSIYKGEELRVLGDCYARAIQDQSISFDMLFGPAYKGIGLVHCAAISLSQLFNQNIPIAFNRKEKKDHGESGSIVGSDLKGNVLIIDDVITAGTAIRESIEIIKLHGANPVGICVALDRQERGLKSNLSAIQEIEKEFSLPVYSIINLSHLLDYFDDRDRAISDSIAVYKDRYGVS
jgi:orotate phosphoribosyltransferase